MTYIYATLAFCVTFSIAFFCGALWCAFCHESAALDAKREADQPEHDIFMGRNQGGRP
jgi:hypothetical protein